MRDLTTVGLSEDGRFVVLASASGEQFQVPADDRLRATLRNDRARLGQLEIEMDSSLRPRDIQARIRRGETPDAVAEAAQVSVEKIMGYAVPVLAEREHVVERARTSTVRRKHSQSGAVTLGEAVDEAIRGRHSNPASAVWDSWRREDGRWTIVVGFGEDNAEKATYVFDAPGRYVTADDETSRALVGDLVPGPDSSDMAIAAAVSEVDSAPAAAGESPGQEAGEEEPGVTSLRRARARRALAQEQLRLGDDAGEQPEGDDDDTSEPVEPAPETGSDGSEGSDDADSSPVDAPAEAVGDASTATDDEDEAPARKRGKRRERRRVPSWDEIMFGDKNS